LACGLGAYLAWGFVAAYFKLLAHVPAIDVLAHRILWSAILLAILVAVRRGGGEIARALRRRDVLLALSASTILISINWFTFIYSVEKNILLQASLGYFINPLVNVLLGVVFLSERLRPAQLVGLGLATAGVGVLSAFLGQPPWIAMILAVSFGFYGLLRKTMHIGAIAGLTVETWLLFLPAALLLIVRAARNNTSLLHADWQTNALLVLSGVVTAVPLLMFAAAARRLRLSTMGFMQYISPSCQFLLAVLVYREGFGQVHLVAFGLIWTALAVYTIDSYRAMRRRSLSNGAAPEPQAQQPA
jgi:chloramphenicol-sensitive protein RarD